MHNTKITTKIEKAFFNALNIFILEDNPGTLEILLKLLQSPMIRTFSATTVESALKTIKELHTPLHCQIVDISIGEDAKAGLDFLNYPPRIPFTIIFSGMQSMNTAFDASRKGVASVIDKGPATQKILLSEVCKTVSLGFLLAGHAGSSIQVFRLLSEQPIESHHDWAQKAYIVERQLYNITTTQIGLTPLYTVKLFYAIAYCLRQNLLPDEPSYSEIFQTWPSEDFLMHCLDFVETHLDNYKRDLINSFA